MRTCFRISVFYGIFRDLCSLFIAKKNIRNGYVFRYLYHPSISLLADSIARRRFCSYVLCSFTIFSNYTFLVCVYVRACARARVCVCDCFWKMFQLIHRKLWLLHLNSTRPYLFSRCRTILQNYTFKKCIEH